MDFKFSKDSGDFQPEETPGKKRNQSTLFVLLLVLIGGFAYLYLFTSLIKPQEAQKIAEVPAPAPKAARIPLPPRVEESAKPAGNVVTPKAMAPAPGAVAVAAANKLQPKIIADKKGNTPDKSKTTEIKTAAADNKSVPAKAVKKIDVASKPAKPKLTAKAKRATSGPWSLVVGNYVLEEALAADIGRVRKAGFEPVVKLSVRKKAAMNRLLVSECSDRAAAQSILNKLKQHTSDAFVIEQGGKFAVYAGSYLQSASAQSEKDRLEAIGFPVSVRHTDIAIPSQRLSVGPFTSRKAADAAIGKLKSAGIKVTLAQK